MRVQRWGVLSTSRFARHHVIPAARHCKYAEIIAIASRDAGHARAAALELGISKAYGSYEELLANRDIDVVYNPLPNHLHVEWSIKALNAGKHVFCEKPIALSSADALRLLEAARQHPSLKAMEGFMYRHHPQWQRTRQLIGEGAIGELRTIWSVFTYHNIDPGNIRNNAQFGGGGMMDIGCYNVSVSRFLFGGEPARVMGIVEFDPHFKVDRLASAILDFGRGTSTFTCSTQLPRYQRVHVFGTAGRIEIEIPFNAPHEVPVRIWLQRGNDIEEIVFEPCDQYAIEIDLFSLAVMGEIAVPIPLEDSIANMRAIEAVFESAKKKAWENL